MDLPTSELSKEAQKMRDEIELKEMDLRTLKLRLRKQELVIEVDKIDYEIVNMNNRMKEIRDKLAMNGQSKQEDKK